MSHTDPQQKVEPENVEENTTNNTPEEEQADHSESGTDAAETLGAENATPAPAEDAQPEDGAAQSASPAENLEDPEARIAALEAKLAEATDRTLRAMAETENIRKRSDRERQDMAKFAISGFAKELLSVADNLGRALEAITPEMREGNAQLDSIYTGVEATERELLRAFVTNGISQLDPMGQKFDPNLHEVMLETESADEEPGTILHVINCGYTIHDRLLRPARVSVAKRTSGDAPPPHEVDEEV